LTVDPIVPVVVGGFIAVIGGLVGAWIQSGREHKKWLREKRLEAYIPMIAFLTEYEIVLSSLADIQGRVEGVAAVSTEAEMAEHQKSLAPYRKRAGEYRERVSKEMAAISVLGPESLAEAARQWEETSRTTSVPWFKVGNALVPIIAQMRKALDIKD
jgi:hypothetical protein